MILLNLIDVSCCLQAQKRKLGLLGNDDLANLASSASAKDREFENRTIEDEASAVLKCHGTSIDMMQCCERICLILLLKIGSVV